MPPKHYGYPAIIRPDDDGWTARFPDLENCFTCGNTVEEVILEAQAVLEECLYFRETTSPSQGRRFVQFHIRGPLKTHL